MALNSQIKPEKVAAVAAQVIKQSTVVPNLITNEGFDQFVGAENDTVFIKVPGYLPAHEIPNWRAERTTPLILDAFSERKIAITLGGNTYQSTKLQDEQKDFDLLDWTKVVGVQAEAIARNLEDKAINLVLPYNSSTNPKGVPYEVTIGGADADRSTARTAKGRRVDLVALRSACDKIRMPKEGRIFLVGSAIYDDLLLDDKIVFSQYTSEATAEGALREAQVGRLLNMNIVSAPELPDDFGVCFNRGAFLMATAAPSVPASVGFGATAAAGFATVRFMRDYDSSILSERSILNLYNGTRYTTDVLFDKDNENVAMDANGDPYEYVIRAVAFDLDGSDVLPTGAVTGDRADTFARITGVGTQA